MASSPWNSSSVQPKFTICTSKQFGNQSHTIITDSFPALLKRGREVLNIPKECPVQVVYKETSQVIKDKTDFQQAAGHMDPYISLPISLMFLRGGEKWQSDPAAGAKENYTNSPYAPFMVQCCVGNPYDRVAMIYAYRGRNYLEEMKRQITDCPDKLVVNNYTKEPVSRAKLSEIENAVDNVCRKVDAGWDSIELIHGNKIPNKHRVVPTPQYNARPEDRAVEMMNVLVDSKDIYEQLAMIALIVGSKCLMEMMFTPMEQTTWNTNEETFDKIQSLAMQVGLDLGGSDGVSLLRSGYK